MSRGTSRLLWIATSFLVVSIATRMGLALFSDGRFVFLEWAQFMGIGLIFDFAVLPWFLLPWAAYDLVMPEFVENHRLHTWEYRWTTVWASLFLVLFIVVAAAEFAFWEEFGGRFDFIAVDYLVYTHEVIGNIRESYPVNLWMTIILVICLSISLISWPRRRHPVRSTLVHRGSRLAGVALALALAFSLVDRGIAESHSNTYVQQLSTNGIYAFAHAYQHNQLDYDKYYPTLTADELNSEVRTLVHQTNSEFTTADGIERRVTANIPAKKINIVLVTVESLSAEFLGRFGNELGLTPELDKLAGQGLLFTNLYATGTRTVRGLEALTVGTPPTPGQSIVRRPDNDGLRNLGAELKERGWKSYWIYGGYGLFDNMNAYFEANEYIVVDRNDVQAEGVPVHFENIWGIADEDLYSLAMAKLDQEHVEGNLFFAQIMTTSNHRPYTFPENRIDLPQMRRESAVKYADWAIGDFIRRSAAKPWFDNTLFIIISDHTSKAAGRIDLPPSRYHIPMIWYAPGLIEPGVMGRLMSQIDVPPTLLGWLGINYSSRFFGYDMSKLEVGRERAFISTYQKLGYLKGNRLVVLDVNRDPVVVDGLPAAQNALPATGDQKLVREAISWYQAASLYFRTGQLKDVDNRDKK